MKFLILACIVLSAVAEPEPQHETVGFTKHLNGAVVPVDTTSVLQQKALHGAAHATAAVNGFKFPFYVRPAVAPVVKAVEPTIKAEEPVKVAPYTYPFTYGLQYPYGLHPLHDSLMELIIPLIPLTEFIILARERPRPRLKLILLSSTLITMATPTPLMATPTPLMLPTPTPTPL